MRRRSPVAVTLTLGSALIAAVLVAVLAHSPPAVLSSSSTPAAGLLAPFPRDATVCQAGERIPAATTALRISLLAHNGPALSLSLLEGSRTVARGRHGAGWVSGSLTFALSPAPRRPLDAAICLTRDPVEIGVDILGDTAPRSHSATVAGVPIGGRMRIEYLAPGNRSWLSLARHVARRLGLGHEPSGAWTALTLGALMIVVAALTAWLLLAGATSAAGRRASRVAPAAGWACALVALLSAICWSLITPPFQVPDEPSHFAYVKQLAEAHALPSSHAERYSREESVALADLQQGSFPVLAAGGTISSRAQQQKLARDLATFSSLPAEGSAAAGVATSEPPLYYLLETVPYLAGSSGSLLTRLALMRALSALFAGVTALFAFLFVSEALPARRLDATIGGLAVALAPLLGFMSGAVNPDALLFAVSAALFWSLARCFRRGLSYRGAATIGAVAALGLMTKLNFIGLLPGALLGLGVLALRMARSSRPAAARAFALGAGIALSPVVVFALVNLATGRATLGLVSSAASSLAHGSILAAASSTWQLFLPRLPGMHVDHPGVLTTRQVWLNGFVGQYGWVETAFPAWVYDLALLAAVAIAIGCARTLLTLRLAVRARVAELLVYALMSAGLATLIGGAAYFGAGAGSFTQARYLLPLMALLAAALALATRAAGRRWEAVLGAIVVLAMFSDELFSQLQVIARYYG